MNLEKEKRAIEYLKSFEPEDEPYYLCYSGGKDSDCIRILAQLAGVKHELHHNLTTVDAPETVQYVKSIPGIIIHKPELTMWQLIVKKKIPPTRLIRYCCSELKEQGGKGRMKITGVRWEESNSRKETADVVRIVGKPKTTRKLAEDNGISFKSVRENGIALNNDNAETRRFVESCYRTTSTLVNPIVDWTTTEVWDFFALLRMQVESAIRVRIKACRLHWMSDGRIENTETSVCGASDILQSLYSSVSKNGRSKR